MIELSAQDATFLALDRRMVWGRPATGPGAVEARTTRPPKPPEPTGTDPFK